MKRHDWAIVLAAGEGTRLGVLTDGAGRRVPKQFWSICGSRSLLGDALERAAGVVPRDRIVVVVAAEHDAWWSDELAGLPRANVVVQPRNRGTAAGLLLPLLTILERDSEARVLVLPSDHFVASEPVLCASLGLALDAAGPASSHVALLGIEPAAPETGFGWIVPEGRSGALRRVAYFVEKPPRDQAEALMERGALWNSFLLAARGRALLELSARRLPRVVAALSAATRGRSAAGLEELYEHLPVADFSREVLEHGGDRLRVLRVPDCGWTDLGTPGRVVECVNHLGARGPVRPEPHRARFRLRAALGLLGVGAGPMGELSHG